MGLFKRKDSPYWWYSVKLEGQKRIYESTQTHDRRLAQQIYIAKRSQYQKFQYGFELKKVKLGELITDYLELYSKHSKITYQDDVERLGRIQKFFGDVYLTDITPARLEEYRIKRLSEGIAKSTTNREMGILKHTFNKGIEWGKCENNPVRKIKFYSEKENARMRYLDQQEKVKLLNECPLPTKRFVFFALNTGMRQGEILNLKWKDIDYKTNLIKINHSKSGNPRYVPMNSELLEMLKSMPSISEYIFGSASGKPKWGLYRNFFERAVKKAEIKDFCFHSCRHTFASDLVMKGVDLKTVSELLGHSTMRMTERYSHLSPAHKLVAVEMLPKGLMCYAGVTLGKQGDTENVKNDLKNQHEEGWPSGLRRRFAKPLYG